MKNKKRKIKKILKIPRVCLSWLIVQSFRWIYYDSKYLTGKWFEKVNSKGWEWAANDIIHRILFGTNRGVRWPVSPYGVYGNDIRFDVNDINNFMGNGSYFQTLNAKITIGSGTWIARNVGLITSNHNLEDPGERQQGQDIYIGEKCWIGMNAVILPGVVLGDHTVVGAGAVVTKSFPDGHCVVAGNPAKIIKKTAGIKKVE